MRLTLRTLLAFLDDVLEPADAEQLEKKIQDSEFASGLVHRIRSTMRKLRLGAPKLEGKGMGLDPNTVSEYLDSTLSPDRVPDFEKVCLESDVHLAEVASCHQILTLVLGEPADVPAPARQRVYRIASLSTHQPATGIDSESATAAGQLSPTDGSSKHERLGVGHAVLGVPDELDDSVSVFPVEERVTRPKPEVPDYLRAGSRRRFLPYVVTALLVFLIASVAFLAIGPEPFSALFDRQSTQVSSTDDQASVEPPAATSDIPAPAKTNDNGRPSAPANDSDHLPRDENVETEADVLPPADPVVTVTNPQDDVPSAVAQDEDDPPEPKPIPGITSPELNTAATDSTEGETPMSPISVDGGPDDTTAPVIPEATTVTADVGRYTSEKQVLARYNVTSNDWFRLPTDATLAAGDRLLVLPNYRPQLALASGIQLTFAGASLIELQPLDEHGSSHLSIQYGRTKLVTIGRAGAQIGLHLGQRHGVVTFANADARMAIDVSPYLAPGSNPELDPVQTIVQITSTSGSVVWEEASVVTAIEEGNVYVMIDDAPGKTVKVEEFEPWISSTGPTGIQQIAAQELEPLLDEKRPLVVSLEERVADDRVEIVMLASRCLSSLDRHESFVATLSDGDNRSFWEESFDAAQAAIWRGPESASAVRAAFEKLRGEDADQLYRLVWGYSDKQLRDEDADNQLVEYLNHESMDYRVLAFINLRRITGLTHLYRPEVSLRYRAGKVQKWREKASAGEIIYKTPPLPPVPHAALDAASATSP